MNNNLQTTLSNQLKLSSPSPAFKILLNDYAKYHQVLVITGGLSLLALIALCVLLWLRFKRTPKVGNHKWTFEKKVYFILGTIGTIFSLFLALVFAANLSTALQPRPGFSLLINGLGTPPANTQMSQLQQTANTWVQSSSATTPASIQKAVNDRLSWQRPKAIISIILLIVFVTLSVYAWKVLIQKSRSPKMRWSLKDRLLTALGATAVLLSLLLVVMAIANTQASFAPLVLTVIGANG